MPTSLGPAEILVVLVVALIVLGPNRLPEAGRQVGRALAELRRWSQGVQEEMREAMEGEPELPPMATSTSSTPAPTPATQAAAGDDGDAATPTDASVAPVPLDTSQRPEPVLSDDAHPSELL